MRSDGSCRRLYGFVLGFVLGNLSDVLSELAEDLARIMLGAGGSGEAQPPQQEQPKTYPKVCQGCSKNLLNMLSFTPFVQKVNFKI